MGFEASLSRLQESKPSLSVKATFICSSESFVGHAPARAREEYVKKGRPRRDVSCTERVMAEITLCGQKQSAVHCLVHHSLLPDGIRLRGVSCAGRARSCRVTEHGPFCLQEWVGMSCTQSHVHRALGMDLPISSKLGKRWKN